MAEGENELPRRNPKSDSTSTDTPPAPGEDTDATPVSTLNLKRIVATLKGGTSNPANKPYNPN